MSRRRLLVHVASWVGVSLSALPFVSVSGCGQTASIGQVRPDPDAGPGGDGGAAANGAGAGAASGGAAGTSSGGDAGGGNGGESGEAGSAGSAGHDAGMTECGLPRPDPIVNPSPAEQERASLIHAVCSALGAQGCLEGHFLDSIGWISEQARSCPLDQRITACEQDLLYLYQLTITSSCEDEWQSLARCAAAADYTLDQCAEPRNPLQQGPSSRCLAERLAFDTCSVDNSPWRKIVGTRATCNYGPSGTDPSECSVLCTVSGSQGPGDHVFEPDCVQSPGLPLLCSCWVNGEPIHDPTNSNPYAVSNCGEMAQLMADGACVERLECCLTWVYEGVPQCACVPNAAHGMASCEAAAQAAGGAVVEICPQYEPDPGTCWPPWSCGGQGP